MIKRLILSILPAFCAMAVFGELPDRFVDYVESIDKTTYINTGICAIPKTTKVFITVAPTALSGTQCFFGTFCNNEGTKNFHLTFDKSGVIMTHVNTAATGKFSVDTKYTFSIENCSVNVEDGTSTKCYKNEPVNGRNNAPLTKPIILFSRSDEGNGAINTSGAKMRLYGCRIYLDGETLSANYIPCVKNGVAGLYDTVSDTVLYPENGKELVASEEANQEIRIENGVIQTLLAVNCSGEGGSCSSNGTQWKNVGDALSFTATPDEGMQAVWRTSHEDEISKRSYGGNSLAFAMPPFKVDVDLSFSDSDYLPKVSNLASLVAAAEDGAILQLGEGTYYIDREILIDKNITLQGLGMDSTFIKPEGGVISRGAKIMSDCLVKDLTIAGFTNYVVEGGFGGSGIYMENGTLENVRISGNQLRLYNLKNGVGIAMSGGNVNNCIVEDNSAYSGYGGIYGIGIYASGGTITDSIIRNNFRDRSEFYGGGISVSGAVTVRNCIISGNNSKGNGNGSNNTRGMGVYMNNSNGLVDGCEILDNEIHGVSLTGGTMQNCIISGHETTSPSYTAGVEMSGGKLYNCTVTDNVAPNGFAGLKMSGGTAINNIFYGNGTMGDISVSSGTFNANIVNNLGSILTASASGNLATDPMFVNPEERDYSIGFNSPALDAGNVVETVLKDITGRERPQGAGYDIGAYEWMPTAGGELLSAIIIPSSKVKEGTSFSATGRVMGGTGAYSYRWFVDGVETDQTDANPVFESYSPGYHTIRLIVSDGEDTSESVIENAVAIAPLKVYVSKEGSKTFPYDTVEKATDSVNEAFDTLWLEAGVPTEVVIGEGRYMMSGELVCLTPITIEGAGIDRTILDGSNLDYVHRCASISADDVAIKNLTITKYKNNNGGSAIFMDKNGLVESVRITENCARNSNGGGQLSSGVGISMSAGTVKDCIIDSNYADSSYGNVYGVGVRMSGGLVVDTEICENYRLRNQVTGCGAYLSGGKLLRCRVVKNYNNGTGNGSDDTQGIGLHLNGANAIVENCYVISNGLSGINLQNGKVYNTLVAGHKMTHASRSGGIWQRNGALYNCTIAGNTSLDDTKSDLLKTGGTIVNTIAEKAAYTAAATDSNNIINTDPFFKKPLKLDFHLRRSSPAVDGGQNAIWDEVTDATDLDGNRRIGLFGLRMVDIGCYELQPAVRTLIELK